MNLRRLAVELDELLMRLRKYRKCMPGHEESISPKVAGPAWPEGAVPDLWNVELHADPSLDAEPSKESLQSAVSKLYISWPLSGQQTRLCPFPIACLPVIPQGMALPLRTVDEHNPS